MLSKETQKYSDDEYCKNRCGLDYDRSNPHWLSFFGRIADRIKSEIQPSSVLDAGCAKGFLVECLRDRGTEAFGVDLSEHAISQVREDIKQYCWVGSLTEQLPRHFDLIVTIETLEHLPKEEVAEAIKSLCSATDDILFSSTPDDYTEPGHLSVQPPEAWASMFAAQGFWHDAEYDASFITPWAMRFRRMNEPLQRAIIPVERKLWALRRENEALRALTMEERVNSSSPEQERLKARLEQLESTLRERREMQGQVQTYMQVLNEAFRTANAANHVESARHELIARIHENHHLTNVLSATIAELDQKRYQSAVLESRLSYKVLRRAIRIIDLIVPEGSFRSRAWQKISPTLRGQHRLKKKESRLEAGAAVPETMEVPQPVVAARAAWSMPYDEWVRDMTPSQAENAVSKRVSAACSYQPIISLVTPVYDPPLSVLHDTIESVIAQIYDRWELCLVDGASKNPAIRELLRFYAQRDSRIKVQFLDANLGISGNTNEAAKLATGEFLQIFDHDDTLEPYALLEAAKVLNVDPTLDIIYFDEDKLSADGSHREEPFFKPDWSPELLLSTNYLTHAVVRRSLYEAVGGCDPEMDGAQDWDLAFRLTELTQRIYHIPQVLYHWHKVPGSAPASTTAKPYEYEPQLRSISGHLERTGISNAQAKFTATSGGIQLTWPITEELVSIIIPTKDKVELLQQCLESLTTVTAYRNFEIILVDTGSVEQRTHTYYSKLKAGDFAQRQVKIVDYEGQFNYSRANNIGAAHARGKLLLFLNNDTEIVESDWLHELVRWVQMPDIGVVGAKLLFPTGHLQHAGVILGMSGHAGHIFEGLKPDSYTLFGPTNWYRNFMAVTGACMMTRRGVFDAVGGFDEQYQICFSDVEFCLQAHDRGYRILFTPYACLTHHEGASRGLDMPVGDINRAYELWYSKVDQGDPYYNVNLSTEGLVPALATNDTSQRLLRLQKMIRQFDYLHPDSTS